MAFLLAEDEALKLLLLGLTVSDEHNSARPVGVWFGLPDPEVREKKYPFISIDLVNVAFAAERAQSGPYYHKDYYEVNNVPLPTDNKSVLGARLPPTPYNLDYQITTWSRFPRHDRQLLAQLLGGPLPFQFGSVSVPVDGTVRRVDLTSISKRDILDANKKKIFRNVFSVRVSSELFYYQLQNIGTVWESAIVQGDPTISSMSPIETSVLSSDANPPVLP